MLTGSKPYLPRVNPLQALSLTPLDRILIRQSAIESRLYGSWEDWRYFVAYDDDGRLTVANTIGHTRSVQWNEVESIEKRSPIIVRALTHAGYCARPSSGTERNTHPLEWHPATVIMAHADTRGNVERFHIRLDNGEEWATAGHGVIHNDDIAYLIAIVNRGVMPVITSKRGCSADAKGQAGLDARRAKRIIDATWRRALAGATLATDHDLRVVR